MNLVRDYRSHTQVVELANRLLEARRPGKDVHGVFLGTAAAAGVSAWGWGGMRVV